MARNARESRPGQEVPPESDHLHESALQRDTELQQGRLRSRPAANRGGRFRRQLQSLHGRELREPAAGLELLPDLPHGDVDAEPECQRPLRLAARRPIPEGNDEHVWRKLRYRVRAAPVQLLPEPEPRHQAEDEQLPQRPQLQPLPRLTRAHSEERPSGRFSLYLGIATERTFDQLARQGFAGRQSNPVTSAETWTQ